jgi:hypothetical protein
MTNRKISQKQQWIIEAVRKGNQPTELNPTHSWLDMDQLLEAVPYETTKESMQFSLRHLIAREFLINGGSEVRRGRKRRTLVPTEKASNFLISVGSTSVSMTDFEDENGKNSSFRDS